MGFPPDQVDRMSLWQLNAAAAGFSEAHGAEMETGLSDSEFKEISEMLDGG